MLPGVKLIRRLAITLAVLATLFVALNLVAERVAESRLSTLMQDRFELEEPPNVNLKVFPIVTTILSGRLPGISIAAEGLTVEGLDVARLSVELKDVGIDAGGLLGGDLTVSVGEGRIDVELEQGAVNRYLRDQGEDARVTLRPDRVRVRGTTTILGGAREYDARGRLRLKGNELRFIPDRVLIDGEPPPPVLADQAEREARFSVEIPELPGGFAPDRVASLDGSLTISAVLEDAALDLSGRG